MPKKEHFKRQNRRLTFMKWTQDHTQFLCDYKKDIGHGGGVEPPSKKNPLLNYRKRILKLYSNLVKSTIRSDCSKAWNKIPSSISECKTLYCAKKL